MILLGTPLHPLLLLLRQLFKFKLNFLYYTYTFSPFCALTGPPGGLQYRAPGLGHRPFMDGFPKAYHDLETLRRSTKAANTAVAAAASAAASVATASNALTTSASIAQQLGSNFSSSNSTINSDCQGYKPNAPQIQGKCHKWPAGPGQGPCT